MKERMQRKLQIFDFKSHCFAKSLFLFVFFVISGLLKMLTRTSRKVIMSVRGSRVLNIEYSMCRSQSQLLKRGRFEF